MKIHGSIRRRLIISLILLAIIPLLLMGALLSWQSFVIQQRQIIELQSEEARRVLNQIGSIIHGKEKELIHALAIDHYILDVESEKQRNNLSHLLSFADESNISIFNDIALLDSRGQELARESRTSIITPKDLRDRSNTTEFTAPMASRETYYGPVYINDKTGVPFILMSIPVIDTRSNTVKGVLAAEMSLKFMWDIVDKINVDESGLVYIVDSTGRVIVHPNPSVVLKGEHFNIDNKSGPGTGLDGEKAILTNDILTLGTEHLHIMTEIPLVKALKSTYTSLITIAVFLVLTLTGAIVFGIIIVRQIIRPVESLAETAQAISSGDISRRSDISGNDELGALSDTFNLMTSRLTETITSLKNEIANKERVEKKIRLAYEEWQRTFDSISQPVSIHDREYRIIRANKAFSDFFKKSLHDLIGKKCFEIFHCSTGPLPNCPHTKTLDTRLNRSEELFEPNLDKHLRVTTSPILNDLGEVTGSVHIAEDITERKFAEEKLTAAIKTALEEKSKLDAVIAGIGDGISIQDTDFKVLYQNDVHKSFVGAHEGEFCYKAYENRDDVCEGCPVARAFRSGIVHTKQRSVSGDLGINYYDITASPIEDSNGKIIAGVEVVRDITGRKIAEEKIMTSLREKEVLLKEIHHRVKNNMQVISSLLNLQARQIRDKKYIELFNESRNRIASMALVHEKLYNSKDLANVDFKDYIHSLVNGLFTFYGISANKVLLKMSIENISLSIDTAIPCGLIINELVSNSLKYAFPEEKKGELQIVLDKAGTDDNNIVYGLIISDNGIGIHDGIDIRKTKSLGLQLVTNLAEHQLQGDIQLHRSGGTSFCIRFRELRYKSRM